MEKVQNTVSKTHKHITLSKLVTIMNVMLICHRNCQQKSWVRKTSGVEAEDRKSEMEWESKVKHEIIETGNGKYEIPRKKAKRKAWIRPPYCQANPRIPDNKRSQHLSRNITHIVQMSQNALDQSCNMVANSSILWNLVISGTQSPTDGAAYDFAA